MHTLITTILFQAAINIFLFVSNRKKNSDDFYLVALMGLFLIHNGFKYYLWLVCPDPETFDKIHGSFSLLYGPCLLFYLNAVEATPLSKRLQRIHFIPFLLAFVLNIKILAEVLVFKNVSVMEDFHWIMVFFMVASMSVYALTILIRLKKLPGPDDVVHYYKIRIVALLALFLLVPGLLSVLSLFVTLPRFFARGVSYVALISILVAILSFRFKISGLQKGEWVESLRPDVKKYQNSSLSDYKLESIGREITAFMTTHKPYLDMDFSLDSLAEMTSIPKHHITEGLNLSLQINFYKFTNQFRVEESKRLIREMNPTQNLMEIGLQSGFKSKSTFNKYFKDLTGQSPSEYARLIDHGCGKKIDI